MVIIALDIGEKRCGVAVCDHLGKIAIPLCVLSTNDVLNNAPSFKRLMQDYDPQLLLIGLPLSLDGGQNNQARRVKFMAENIAKTQSLPIIYQDERLSSSEAKRILKEQGCTEKEMRGKIDMIAASVFLQTYLDSMAR